MPVTVNATFCATLVDQWVRYGLTHAFIAPGSRSTPLSLELVRHPLVSTMVLHDERSAAFAALGRGLATETPAVVVCSSGTAATHFFGAIVEADASAVPLIACTADRPPELWSRGAPQTIDQTELFGNKVRAFIEPGPPDDSDPSTWRSIASAAWRSATGPQPGPVHCNLSFRDPLTGAAGDLPKALGPITDSPESSEPTDVARVADLLSGRQGVIIAGRSTLNPQHIVDLARRLGWPVIGDHRSGVRTNDRHVVHHFDSLLRSDYARTALRPEAVLRIGEILASKTVSQWLTDIEVGCVATAPHGRLIDPEQVNIVTVDECGLLPTLTDVIGASGVPATSGWVDQWRDLDDRAAAAIKTHLAARTSKGSSPSEVDVARETLAAVPPGGALVTASSMAVRNLEWFGGAVDDITVLSNRGANGIDGTIATAIGIAAGGQPTVCLVGDLAFLHDSTSLIGLAQRELDLTIVVIDNDGGAIFSFLPQHELLEHEQYEHLFGTPHATDLTQLCRAHGLTIASFDADAVHHNARQAGIHVLICHSRRDTNLAVLGELHAVVADAMRRALAP